MSELIFKNPKRGNPQLIDPVFKERHRLHCSFCVNTTGRRKTYKSLRALQFHFAGVHNYDAYCQQIIKELEHLLREGVLVQ